MICRNKYNLNDANTLLLKIESAAKEIGLCINSDKTEYININQNNKMQMKSICGSIINQVEDFKYIESYIRSTKRYVNIRISKAWSAFNIMNIIWKSKLSRLLILKEICSERQSNQFLFTVL